MRRRAAGLALLAGGAEIASGCSVMSPAAPDAALVA